MGTAREGPARGFYKPRNAPDAADHGDEESLAALEERVSVAEKRLDADGLEYLAGRGLSRGTVAALRIGQLTDGTYLLPVLMEDRPVYGIEHRPQGDPKYRFPKGQTRPLIGAEDLVHDGPVLAVEGYFDWAVLFQAGFRVVAFLGAASRVQVTQLRSVSDVVIMFDGDDAGRESAEKLAAELYPRGRVALLPEGEDPNSIATSNPRGFEETVRELVDDALDPLERALSQFEKSQHLDALKQCCRFVARMEVESFQEDAAVRRAAEASRAQGVRMPTIRREVARVRECLRARRIETDAIETARGEGPAAVTIDPEIAEAAEKLLEDSNLLSAVIRETTSFGYRGEEVNRQVALLAGVAGHTARDHRDAIHLVVKGDSSAGKNELLRTVFALLPEGRVRFLTGVSRLGLVYEGGRIEGVLVFQEAEGEDDAEYVVRQAMSEGWLERITVIQGESCTVRTYVAGSVVTTTTAVALHDENETRVFDLVMDTSEALTREVVRAVAESYSGGGIDRGEKQRVLKIWRAAIAMLEPSDVVIPYATNIADRFPVTRVRARRDIGRTLNLVRASCLLHQRSRERDDRDRLVASVEDYALVYPLLQRILGPTMSGWTDKALEIARVQNELQGGAEVWIQRAKLQAHVESEGICSPSTLQKWCRRFIEAGAWEGRKEEGRWEHRSIRDLTEEPVGLPRPDEIEVVRRTPESPSGSDLGGGA